MRVLIWSQHFWPEEFYINDVAFGLVEAGCEVSVVTGRPNYPDGLIRRGYARGILMREVQRGVNICRLPLIPRGQGRWYELVANYLSFVLSGMLIAPLAIRNEEFDVILIYGTSPILQAIPPIMISQSRSVPAVLWVQDLWPDALRATGFITNTTLLRMVGKMVVWIYQRSYLVLVQSKSFASKVQHLASPPGGVRVLYNSLRRVHDENSSSDAGTASEYQRGIHSRYALFAGNIGRAQLCDVIVDAAKCLVARSQEDVQIVLLGSGSRARDIDGMIAKYQLKNICRMEPISRGDAFRMMQKSVALLLTIGSDSSAAATIPSKLQTYLAAGRPIVVLGKGEAADIVEEAGAGFVARSGQPDDVATMITRVLQMSTCEYEEMCNKSRRCYEAQFDFDGRLDELQEYLEQAVEGRKGLRKSFRV